MSEEKPLSKCTIKKRSSVQIEMNQCASEATETNYLDFSQMIEKYVFEGILIINNKGKVVYCNDSATLLLGRSRLSLIDNDFGFPILVNEFTDIEVLRPDGTIRIVEMRATNIKNESGNFLFISLWDVTENTELKEQLKDLAIRDELTNLLNRRGFLLLANQQLIQKKRHLDDAESDFMLIFMDIDKFKSINDSLGHEQGDQYLIDIATILRDTFRGSDLIGRIGGDEFVVLTLSTHEVAVIQERLQENIDAYNKNKNTIIPLSLSIGISQYNSGSNVTLEELIQEADTLMYEVKRKKYTEQ